jgi:hypothetical protein
MPTPQSTPDNVDVTVRVAELLALPPEPVQVKAKV